MSSIVKGLILSMLALAALAALAGTAHAESERPAPRWHEHDTLTGGGFGAFEKLEEHGVKLTLGLTQIYQRNLRGGMRADRDADDYSGSYDIEVDLDSERLVGLAGGLLHFQAKGGWSDGVDPRSVGSLFGVNADAFGDRPLIVAQLYWEQALLSDMLTVRLGKIDLTGGFECHGCPVSFDGNTYANDETLQFLNGAFVNNPTIPFPAQGLGAVVFIQPAETWYVSFGAADARAREGTSGVSTAFHGRADYLFIAEAGCAPKFQRAGRPLPGAYRVGVWHDLRRKPELDGDGRAFAGPGLYISADQKVWNEKDSDSQGLGLFGRYGVAPASVNEIKSFWSLGAQYEGLLPRRDADILGLGVAQGRVSAAAGHSARHETAVEMYYSFRLTPWLFVAPDIQYIINPGAERGPDNAIVAGLRVQMTL